MRHGRRRMGLLVAMALAHGACATPPSMTASDTAPLQRRAVLVSLDALSEARVRALPPGVAPHLNRLFDEGACAAWAVASFPSVTAAGHAAISTGTWGNVNGVAANLQPLLPRDRNRLTEQESAFLAGPLRAEPIWISAALAGLDVVSHHFTQAPQRPGYRPVQTGADSFVVARARADSALALPGTALVNGYNQVYTRGIVISHETAPSRPAEGWTGLDALPAGTLPPREAAWQVLDDSVFALLYGVGRYTHARVALRRDVRHSVEMAAAPADTTPLRSRPLARHFSRPLTLTSDAGRVFLRTRLFDLADDGSSFLFFHPALGVVQTNRPDIDAEYDAAVSGWAGNGAYLMGPNGFGRPLADGGDGTAEARYLETLEHVTRQYMAGAEWAWRTRRPSLFVDYFPMIDEIDHNMYGWLTPETPGHDAVLAARYTPFRDRGWELTDMRLAALMEMVAGDPDAALFVTGDHGMRPYWRVFRANVALRDAGLLVVDSAGDIDLSRTRAIAPNGFWISVNHTGWRDGIVPADSIAAVVAAAEQALFAARGVDGEPVVTRTWRPTDPEAAELGIGGPGAGDLYFDVARGYYYAWQHTGPAAGEVRPNAGHGFLPTASDMHTALCGWGAGLAARRSGPARIIDVAPTVADWLAMPPPPHATGTSRLGEWR